jgi:APA family basic amino acid/polyamine antiporter
MISDDRSGEHNRLLRILGVTFGVAVTIGGMIGLGILRTPGSVAAGLHSVWLILLVWLLGGIYSLFATVAAAELGTALPKDGGWYVFARRAFGEYAGFAVGWMDWTGYPTGYALGSLVSAEYVAVLFPGAAGWKAIIAIAILLGLGLVNLLGLKVGSRLQEVTSFGKALILLILIAAAFLMGGSSTAQTTSTATSPTVTTGFLAAFVIAMQGVIYTYDGWYAAIYFSEENKSPGISLPKSMVSAVVLVAVIYLLINAALLYVLPLERLAASELPVADVADVAFGPNGKIVMTVFAIVALLSILNSNLMAGPRIIFAMARDGLFFKKAAEVNEGGTPAVALGTSILFGVPLILLGSFDTLLAINAFTFILLYLSGFVALIVLRRREPDLERPFRAWGYPWTTIVVIIGSVAFLIGAVLGDTINALYALMLIAASYPLYLIAKRLVGGRLE